MNYQYLSNLPPDEALGQFMAGLDGWHCKTETVKTQDALGRVLAEGIYAALCSPHYNAAAMDGIALNTARTFGATETTPVTLLKSDYVVVDTGDPLPEGCDGVVMVEDVVDGENGTVTLYGAAVPWQNVRQIGEDICAGDLLLPSFSQLTPAALGALLAGGVLTVKVLKKPVVGIIPTGDEIVPPCGEPKKGDIIEFNSAIFSAMLTEWGAEPVTFPIVKDVREDIRGALRHALDTCDMVLLGAGSSAGREDFSSEVIGSLGRVIVHGVAMKPGKPAILGICDGKPVVGVPGYPVSGILVLEQFVRPLVDLQLGRVSILPQTVEATLARRVTSSLKYQEHIRVSLGRIGGKIVAVPLNRGAGVVTSFVKADGILEIPQNSEGYEAGERVQIRILRPLAQIQNTLPVIGSHDPLIDELADLLARSGTGFRLSSSHVGSMGGIMAVKRGEAVLGGIHLLDETDGTYNRSYVRRYFPEGGVVLLEGVKRSQGFLVAPGNPKKIRSFEDIAAGNCSFVNRQKGSGTRILTDFLLQRGGIAPEKICGYSREEYTHTGVAAQIAGETADVGVGIYSAAKLYGLDFIPLCEEEYDFLMAQSVLDSPALREMVALLRSDEFRLRLEKMGGYRLEHPGRILEV